MLFLFYIHEISCLSHKGVGYHESNFKNDKNFKLNSWME